MRIHLYPKRNLAKFGHYTVQINLNNIDNNHIEIDSDHIPENLKELLIPYIEKFNLTNSKSGRPTVKQEIINGYYHNTYNFKFKDDVLAWHSHKKRSVHTSEVIKGSFKLRTIENDRNIIKGDFIDFKPFEFHEFIALEDDSILLNIIKRPIIINPQNSEG